MSAALSVGGPTFMFIPFGGTKPSMMSGQYEMHTRPKATAGINAPSPAQGFCRREREIPFEPAEFRAREAVGCKPLGRFRRAIVFSRVISFVIAGTKRCGTTITV